MKTFAAKDPAVLPPSPSPRKVIPTTTPVHTDVRTPGKPAKVVNRPPPILAVGNTARPSTPVQRPTSPIRQITQVKEFSFASRQKKSPEKKTANEETQKRVREESCGTEDVRVKAREVGVASILAWGETRGRYLE